LPAGSHSIAAMAETSGKKQAQERADRVHAFRLELAQLEREGILVLDEEQRSRLGAHLEKTLSELAGKFDVDVNDSQKQISLAMRIASALGGLALCAAVVLFFYRYWGILTTPLQVGIVIVTPILGLIAMEYISRKERTLYYTSLLGIVVFASFVLNLNVVGFVFNMAPSQHAFLAWGVFALALAYGYRPKLHLAAGLVLVVIFLALELTLWSGGAMESAFERPETFLPGGLALLAIPVIMRHNRYPGFETVYRMVGLLFVFLAILLLGTVGQLTYLPLSKKTVEVMYQMTGLGASALIIWIGLRRRWTEAINLGSGFFVIYLFTRMFAWWWDWMPKYLFFLILGILALVLLAVFRRFRSANPIGEAP
jgi:uncharacterized membrane protein